MLELGVEVVDFLAQLELLAVDVRHFVVAFVSVQPLVPQQQVVVFIKVEAPYREVVACELPQNGVVIRDPTELPFAASGVADN